MRPMISIIMAAALLAASPSAHAKSCRTSGSVSESDSDGSIRLTYLYSHDRDKAELILREGDGVVIARGFLPEGSYGKEVYAMYDLNNGNLVHAKGKFFAEPAQLTNGFPTMYSGQSRFDIRVFAVGKTFTDDFKVLLAQYRENGCHDEILKMSQGREFDKAKCGKTVAALNKVITQLTQPDKSSFTELTKDAQYQRYIDKLLTKHECYIIEKMNMTILTKLRDPKTQSELSFQQKKPSYLDDDKGITEVETVERYRYK